MRVFVRNVCQLSERNIERQSERKRANKVIHSVTVPLVV